MFQKVRDEAKKETDAALNLSGSDVGSSGSSDRESADEDWSKNKLFTAAPGAVFARNYPRPVDAPTTQRSAVEPEEMEATSSKRLKKK